SRISSSFCSVGNVEKFIFAMTLLVFMMGISPAQLRAGHLVGDYRSQGGILAAGAAATAAGDCATPVAGSKPVTSLLSPYFSSLRIRTVILMGRPCSWAVSVSCITPTARHKADR